MPHGPLPSAGLLLLPLPKTGGLEEASLLPSFWEGRKLLFFRGVLDSCLFQANLLLNMLWTLTFFMKICWKKLSPKNRKFRSLRGSETRRKLDSVKCFVGLDSNFLWGVFGLYLFLASLPLNMLVTLDSNFFHENLLERN